MDRFFPCSQVRFKKLLKIIELDWKNEEKLKETLKIYFQNRIHESAELWRENSRKYFDFKQKEADANRLIESGKRPNGLPISKDEMKQAKSDKKGYKAGWKEALSNAKLYKKSKEQLQKHLEFL